MTKKYKSKYADLTDEERKQIKREYYKKWIEKQSSETLEKYRKKTRDNSNGFCEKCNTTVSNMYSHVKSQKHCRNDIFILNALNEK